jgi:methyltransferase domain protein
VNLILIEVEYVRKEFFLYLFKILNPSAAFILQLDKEDSAGWISAILESQILSIDVDIENISNSQQFSYTRINNTLWKEVYSHSYKDLVGLNIGCGQQPLPNWLNTDIVPHLPHIYYMDARLRFPFPDNSFHNIFSEHMFEHLNFKDGVNMLQEVYRVLDKNGIFTLSIPTLDFLIKLYNSSNDDIHQEYIEWSISRYDQFTKNFYQNQPVPSMFVINNFMRFWGHKMIYAVSTLTDILYKIGFREITCFEIGEFSLNNTNLEHHGTIIPDWTNKLEAKTLVCYK